MATRQAIREQVAREFGYYLEGTSNATGGSTTTVADSDTEITSSRLTANFFIDKWVLLTSGTDSGEERRISNWASGTLTVERAWSGQTVAQNITFEVHVLRPSYINQKITDALRKIFVQRYAFISQVVDADKQASGTADWTATSSSLTKSVTAVPWLYQSLRVTNTSANGQAASTAFLTEPGQTYLFGSFIRPGDNNDDARLRWLNANSALVGSELAATGVTRTQWLAQILTQTTGSNGATATAVLRGTGATDIIDWGPTIVLPYNEAHHFLLPSWVTHKAQVQRILWLRNHGPQQATNRWGADNWREVEDIPHASIDGDPTAAGAGVRIYLPSDIWSETLLPVAIARVPLNDVEPASSDTSDIDMPLDFLKAVTLREIYKDLEQQRPDSEKGKWGGLFLKWAAIARSWDEDTAQDEEAQPIHNPMAGV